MFKGVSVLTVAKFTTHVVNLRSNTNSSFSARAERGRRPRSAGRRVKSDSGRVETERRRSQTDRTADRRLGLRSDLVVFINLTPTVRVCRPTSFRSGSTTTGLLSAHTFRFRALRGNQCPKTNLSPSGPKRQSAST